MADGISSAMRMTIKRSIACRSSASRHHSKHPALVRDWLGGSHRSLKGEAAQEHLQALLPALLEQIARTDNPGATLVLFDHFLANLHGAARLLSLLRQNPDLIALIALVLGTAPRLGDILARHPQVIDALVDPSFFGALPGDANSHGASTPRSRNHATTRICSSVSACSDSNTCFSSEYAY